MKSRRTIFAPDSQLHSGTARDEDTTGLRTLTVTGTYVALSELEPFLLANEGHTLAVVCYGRDLKSVTSHPYPSVQVDLLQFTEPSVAEVWTSALPVTHYEDGQIRTAMNDQVLFGSTELEDSEPSRLDTLAYEAYSRVFNYALKLGYPNLLRIWNHFPAINREHNGLEQYQRFCIGRHRAFQERQTDFKCLLPAATTVGTRSGPLQIRFLAGNHEGRHIENPRQVSAYHYPSIYGPRSPAFARATLAQLGSRQHLFIAGTASIVGHASQHIGDPCEQTRETLRNLEALITHVGKGKTARLFDPTTRSLLKVFIRYPRDFEMVRDSLDASLDGAPSVLYLQGDICRRELLVEIEGMLEAG